MHHEPQHAVLANDAQSDEAFPGFQAHVVCIAKLSVLREL